MADALISVLLEQFTSIICQQVEHEVRLVVGVDKEVEKIKSNLKAIQAVLEDAERRQVNEATVRDWLEKLKDVSFEMDDVLDEWNTEILKQQVVKQEKEGDQKALVTKKVCFSIPSHCFCFRQISVVIHHDIAHKIKDLNDRITEIANERQRYNFQYLGKVIDQPERLKTSSFVDISKIIGRENEKDFLLSKLLSKSTIQEESGPLVIPIVGMGGIGKTTLAQLAYNDENVKVHFEKRIWVCVSDPFEEIKIAKAILESPNRNDTPNSNELQTLLECVHKSVEGKKFLIVLDDVWTEDYRKWEPLKQALQSGAQGSRILVTTRKEGVAIMMEATTHMIKLKELSEQICWKIFNHIAFSEGIRDGVFEAIGKEIVKKCKGLPLAAKTLGSLMRYKKTRKEWLDVLDSKIWDLEEVEQQVFQALLLSYYDLSSPVKRCLLYCAIFPKDYEFDKDNLIDMWMSQDYLNSNKNKEKEIIGQQCYENLVMRSFFQEFEVVESNRRFFKMHDIVHDFVQFLTKNECFIMEANDVNERKKVMDNEVRHMSLMSKSDDGSFPVSIYNCKKLRTLVAPSLGITTVSLNLILQLKCLRTLDFSRNSIKELPKEIGGLIHLRYLNLSENDDLKELPDTVGNLYNLQTLRLTWCRSLETLPETMGKLSNLRHLYMEYCLCLKLPKAIGRLTGLRRLDEFYLYDGNDETLLKLRDLRNLGKLEGRLGILRLGTVKDVSEAKNALLVNKKHLTGLYLDFLNPYEIPFEGEQRQMDEEILDAFEPPTNLEKLEISNYDGTTLHLNWIMSLNNLKNLYLEYCGYCEFLPPLGKLPSLEYLAIGYFPKLKKVAVDFLGIDQTQTSPSSSSYSFPKLRHLRFCNQREWEEWEGVEGWRKEDSQTTIIIMPCLSHLEFLYCPKLKTLPDFLWKTPVQELKITACPVLKKDYERERGREWPKISHIPKINVS